MAKAPGIITIGYRQSAFGGTPPFTTDLDFDTTTAPTLDDLNGWLVDVAAAWSTNYAGKVSEGCTAGFAQIEYTTDSEVLFGTHSVDDGGATGHPRLPGAAVRMIKNTSRPPGGRKGCCYAMAPVGTAYDDDGVITDSNLDNAFNDFLGACIDADSNTFGAEFLQNHGHRSGGHIVYGTPTAFSTVTAAPTVSFLRARYR